MDRTMNLTLFAIICVFAMIGTAAAYTLVTGEDETVTIGTDGGALDDNVYSAGEDVRVTAIINGDLMVVGGDIEVVAPVRGDVLIGGGTVTIRDTVGGDVRIGGGKVDIEHRVLGYAAREDGGHGRRPVLSYEREYDADDFTAFSVVPAVPADLLGDGGADLLESDSAGVLEVRAIRDDDGDREVSPRPQRRFEVEALGSLVLVEDLDGDQIGDLVVRKPEAVEVYVARRR